MVRQRLKRGPSAVSEETLQALWCALDADDSDQIMPQEMGKFLKRGASDFKSKGPSNLNKKSIELGKVTDGGALACQPTAEMRAALPAELSDEEFLELAKKFCKWLEMSLYKQNLSVHSWFNLFNEVDEDGSGFITFDEFEDVVRHRLQKGPKSFPDEKLKALWCKLDADDSNQIMPQEMGTWLKSGASEVKSKAPSNLNKKNIEFGSDYSKGGAIESTPTAEMRAALTAELTEAELDSLSASVVKWLEELLHKQNKPLSSWFNLFREADEDGSGFITFDELEDILRKKAKVKPAALPDGMLRALWCALDADDSNQIMPQEMGKFLKRNGEIKSKGAPKNLNKKTIELGSHVDGSALKCTPTSELRGSLEVRALPCLPNWRRPPSLPCLSRSSRSTRSSRARPSPPFVLYLAEPCQAPMGDEELLALSKTLKAALEDSLHKQNLPTDSWYRMFKDIDSDGSGFITYDEMTDVMRVKLKLGVAVLSDEKLKALWCALDIDDSDSIMPEELSQFLRNGKVVKMKKAAVKLKKEADLQLEGAPTKMMRAALEAELTDEEMDDYSRKLNQWLEEDLHKQSKTVSSWFNLFRDADEDGSGFISFDELVTVIRQKLKRGPSQISDEKLKALWCALDADNSNQIMPQEFGTFLKRTQSVHKSKAVANLNKKNIELGGSTELAKGRAIDSTPT